MFRHKPEWKLGGLAAVLLLSTACGQLSPLPFIGAESQTGMDDALPAVPVTGGAAVTPARVAGRPVVTVRKGPIAELLGIDGQVGGRDETSLTFPARSKVDSVNVKVGQQVEEGQVLVEADSRDLAKELSSARARLQTSSLRLEYAQADIESRAREGAQRAQIERTRRQTALVDAQAAVRTAEAELERVKAGPSAADRGATEAAVTFAQNAVDRAQTDLDKANQGPDPAELKDAEQRMTAARLALQRAEAEKGRLAAGADPEIVRTAERDLTIAEANLDKANAELERLSNGPDPFVVRQAERQVEQAQVALRNAQTTKGGDVDRARVDVKSAEDRLAQVQEGPRPADIEVARRTAQAAQLAVDSARARLDAAKRGPDKLSLDSATAAVDSARTSLDLAESRFFTLAEGPQPDRVALATNVLEGSRAQLAAAQARQAELLRNPTPGAIRDAEARLAAARSAFERARVEAAQPDDAFEPATLDLALLQRAVDEDQADVTSLERSLRGTRLLAPMSGVITAVNVRANESVEAGRQVLSIAASDETVVRAVVGDREGARLKAGQRAALQLDGKTGMRMEGEIVSVTEIRNNGGYLAQVAVNWDSPAAYGTPASVAVTLSEKEGVLLVPEKAVRSAGPRHYVEAVEGTKRRVVNVEVGITSDGNTEIVGGLQEGQTILTAS